jgi:hypothetical protein
MTRWTFGVEPLEQTKEVAARLRRVTSLLLACEADEPVVAQLIDELERLEAALAKRVPADTVPRIGSMVDGDGRVYLDHARYIGAYDPCFPEYDIALEGEHAAGTVSFPIAYEGPPGVVHGGFLAVFFDCAVQHHNCDVGVAGKTTSLDIHYRRPAPLLRTLAFTIDRVAADSRIRSTGQLFHDERLLCEVRVDAIAGDRDALPEVSPRRGRSAP